MLDCSLASPLAPLLSLDSQCLRRIRAQVPLCIAIFPQRESMSTNDLEPFFHQIRHPITGAVVDKVWFNKGL